jgi:hypothetical protein
MLLSVCVISQFLFGVISQNFVVFQVVTQKPMLILAYKRFFFIVTPRQLSLKEI